MSSGIETAEISRWLYERLTGDPTLVSLVAGRVTYGDYPEEWENPLVQFILVSSRDILGVGSQRIMVDSIWQIKVIDEGSTYSRPLPIAKQIDALLHGASETTAFGHFESVRERGLQYPDVTAGVRSVHLGGMYRVRAST